MVIAAVHACSNQSRLRAVQHCRQAVIGQPAFKEMVLDLQPAKLSPQRCDADEDPDTDATSTGIENTKAKTTLASFSSVGVEHVDWLRAGNMRQPVAALADGTLLVYRENGQATTRGVHEAALHIYNMTCLHLFWCCCVCLC